MWLLLAFVSAALLGLYDTSKKAALENNAVLPVLLLNTLFSTLIFSPFIIDSITGSGWFAGTIFDSSPFAGHPETSGGAAGMTGYIDTHPLLKAHLMVILKSCIVLTSWIFGYFGLKHLPITIVGPINATRPILVLVGAMILFGERLNGWQWAGVILAMISLFLLSRSSRKENVDFTHNRWIWFIAIATIIARLTELLILSVYVLFIDKRMSFKLRDLLRRDKTLSKDLAVVAAPIVAHEIIWSFGTSAGSMITGQLGTGVVAGFNVTTVLYDLCGSLGNGFREGRAQWH